MGKRPFSTKLMILLVIVLAIQASPLIIQLAAYIVLPMAVFLFLPLWGGAILNLILLAMLYEGLTGQSGKSYIYIPIAAYGLYFAVFGAGLVDFYLYKQSIRQQNDTQAYKAIPDAFNLRYRSLVPGFTGVDLSEEYARKLASSYKVEIVKRNCQQVTEPRSCMVSKSAWPTGSAVNLSITAVPVDRLAWWGSIETLVSENRGTGTGFELKSVRSKIIYPWPFPFVGCFLGGSGWGCFFEMHTMRLDGGPTIVQALATLFRLEPRVASSAQSTN